MKLATTACEVSSPKASLVVLHGLSEHSGRYQHVARFFCEKGFSVFLFDLRGHGRSEGVRGDANSLEDFLQDLDFFLDGLKPNGPLFLIGHSFGGQLAINYLSIPERAARFKGALLSSPNIRLQLSLSPLKVQAGRFLSHLAPRFPLANEIPVDFISRDPEVVWAYKTDPLVYRKISARLGSLILENQEQIFRLAEKIRIPVFFMQAGEDRICSPEATREFFQKIPIEDKQIRIYEGLYHEIFNEPTKEKVFYDMEKWIENHIAS